MTETYLLKSSLVLAILYGVYYALMRKSLHHQLNRTLGLFCVIFAALFPFWQPNILPIIPPYITTIQIVAQQVTQLQNGLVTSHQATNTLNVFMAIYWIGFALFTARFLKGLWTIGKLYTASPKSQQWGFRVIVVPKNIPAFTFFNLLFISSQTLKTNAQQALITHEQYHRDQWHSVDTLLLQVLSVVFWFNPFIWLFQRDIRASHEYMADQQVIKTGVDPLEYQQMLFGAQTGTTLALGNYLNNGITLKKRFIHMSNIQNQSKYTYFKALLFIPLMVVLVAMNSFAQTKAQFKSLNAKEAELLLYKLKQAGKLNNGEGLSLQIDLNDDEIKPIYILTHQKQHYLVEGWFVKRLAKKSIAEVHVVKGAQARKLYGKDGKNGAVLVLLKE